MAIFLTEQLALTLLLLFALQVDQKRRMLETTGLHVRGDDLLSSRCFYLDVNNVNDKYLWNTFWNLPPYKYVSIVYFTDKFLKFWNYMFGSCMTFYMHVSDIIIIILTQVFFLNTTRSPNMYPRDSHWGIFRGYLIGGGFYIWYQSKYFVTLKRGF